MKYKLLVMGVVLIMGLFFGLSGVSSEDWSYPKSRKEDQVDDYHGIKVKDPYRYLEELDSFETKQWVHAQNALTSKYLDQIPEKEKIRKRLESLWDYERYGIFLKREGRYFFTKNTGLQNQQVLYTVEDLKEDPIVLLDPNVLSKEGTVAVSFYSPSEDGKLMAFGLTSAGSDWTEIKLLDVLTQKELNDHLKWVKFSTVSWLLDGTGFYYNRYDKPLEDQLEALNYNQKVYFHKIGTSQNQDVLIYQRPDHANWMFSPTVTEDGKYLVLEVMQGSASENAVFYREINSKEPFKEVFALFDAQYRYIANEGDVFWFETTFQAPKGRLVKVDLKSSKEMVVKEVIPESLDSLESASLVGDRFVVSYLKDAHSQIQIFTLDGALEKTISLPSLGTASGFSGKKCEKETFYTFTSFNQPQTIYQYDFISGESQLIFKPSVKIDLDLFETKQVFYQSLDGTKVPMFLVYKKGISFDGRNPVQLYGYGGFNLSITPYYSTEIMAWLELGGVYAVASLRGGGEYGESWHTGGKLENKQNVFDDFISAAEWLIAQKITCPSKLSISGKSNGGLLVGASITQRPDLFGAAIPGVGVMDMLRYHKFTIGWAWVPEYGSSEEAHQFSYLYKYSPLHNIRSRTKYPPTLILTADHDDRVVPSHSFKFAAAMQDAQGHDAPILIRIETSAGHGAGKPTSKIIDETTDKLAFLVKYLKIE